MKNNMVLLLKVQLMNQLKINQLHDKKSNKGKMILMGIVFAILGIVLIGYAFGLAYGMGTIGMSQVIPSYGLTISFLLSFFFTCYKANGTLFGFRDYEIIMALPVSIAQVIGSRFGLMYILNLALSILLMMPMGVAYVMFAKPSMLFYPIWILGAFVAPLIPTTLASIVGALIAFVASKFRHSNIITSVLSFGFIGAVLVVPLFLSGGSQPETMAVESIANMGEMISSSLQKIYPMNAFFTQAVVENNILSFLLFIGISILWYVLFLYVLSFAYKRINTSLMTHKTLSNYKMTNQMSQSPFWAMYKKEWKRFITSSIYLLNMSMGVVMVLIMSVACMIMGKEFIYSALPIPAIMENLHIVIPFIASAVLCMSCPVCVSLALEGKNGWILKSSPLSPKCIYQSKMAVNLSLLLPTAFISSILLSICFANNILNVVFFFVIPILASLLNSVFGMMVNIKIPNYEWTNEVAVVKQSMNSILGLLGSSLYFVVGILIFFLWKDVSPDLYCILFCMITIGIIFFLYKKVISSKLP